MQIVVFEDEQVPRLYPLTVGRAAYALSCGSFRLIDWLARLAAETGAALRGVVRPHLAEIQRLDFPQISPPRRRAKRPRCSSMPGSFRRWPPIRNSKG